MEEGRIGGGGGREKGEEQWRGRGDRGEGIEGRGGGALETLILWFNMSF